MRYSRQRENILRQMRQRYDHPTAYMVFEDLKPAMPKLSLGTVYRNLNQLTDAGELKRIPLPDGSCRFDGHVQPHSHIVCQGCGAVEDVLLPELLTLREQVEGQTSFWVSDCEVQLHGLCPACRAQSDANAKEAPHPKCG